MYAIRSYYVFGKEYERFGLGYRPIKALFVAPLRALKASSLDYQGHTPPAALVMTLMLLTLLSVIISGMMAQGRNNFV